MGRILRTIPHTIDFAKTAIRNGALVVRLDRTHGVGRARFLLAWLPLGTSPSVVPRLDISRLSAPLGGASKRNSLFPVISGKRQAVTSDCQSRRAGRFGAVGARRSLWFAWRCPIISDVWLKARDEQTSQKHAGERGLTLARKAIVPGASA